MQGPETRKDLLDGGAAGEVLKRCYHADFRHRYMSFRERYMLYPEIDLEPAWLTEIMQNHSSSCLIPGRGNKLNRLGREKLSGGWLPLARLLPAAQP